MPEQGGGHVRAGAYADARSWLGPTAAARCIAPVAEGRARCTIQLPSPGTYAIGLYHDADDDNELDRGVFGVPTEGYGFSRNVGGGLSAPGFSEAALQVTADAPVQSVVRIRYGPASSSGSSVVWTEKRAPVARSARIWVVTAASTAGTPVEITRCS